MNVWFWQLLFKKWSQSSIHHLSGLLRTNMTTSFQLACLPIIVSQLINILSLCNIWKLKSTNIYAWPCGLIVIMANVWGVGPGIERCRFEFWQRLSLLFYLGAGCKFLYFKDHRHDQMEIEEFKVNAELSQIRDSYVWVTTVYSSPDQLCFVQHHVGGACTTTYTWNASLNIVFDGFLGLF